MSWSDNRSRDEKKPSLEARRNSLRQVNLVLEKLSKDDDLQDDLKLPEVKRAIQHWTGANRLPPEEAIKLTDHRRIVYVLQRVQMLQSVSKEALIGVPFDQFISGASRIPDSLEVKLFGEDIIDGSKPKPPTQPVTITSEPVPKPEIKIESASVSKPPTTKPREKDISSILPKPTTGQLIIAIIVILIATFVYDYSKQ